MIIVTKATCNPRNFVLWSYMPQYWGNIQQENGGGGGHGYDTVVCDAFGIENW